jgi:transcriptional regulator with XRE-family HTH domain
MLGERLKELRKEKGVSQDEFAKAIYKSRSSVAGYEINDRMPDIRTIMQIADYFKCTLDYLFERSKVKNLDTKNLEKEIELYQNKIDCLKLKLEKALELVEEQK